MRRSLSLPLLHELHPLGQSITCLGTLEAAQTNSQSSFLSLEFLTAGICRQPQSLQASLYWNIQLYVEYFPIVMNNVCILFPLES